MYAKTHPPPIDISSLRALSVLGRGAKGVVFLVRDDSTRDLFALKAISRSSIEKKGKKSIDSDKDAFRRIWFERDVLMSLHHPLLPSLRGLVETEKVVGFLMDCCVGGDLGSLRRRQTEQMFSEEYIRFYAAELVLALEHLHKQRIVYRDLKPENILIQESGHIMLVDFDLSVKLPPTSNPSPNPTQTHNPNPVRRKASRFFTCFSSNSGVSPNTSGPTRNSPEMSVSGAEKSNSFVGTEDYVAPEVIRGNGHDYAVDWWSLGIVLYEMLYGKTPFRGQDRKETFYRILNMETPLAGEKTALRDLIGRLLEKDGEKRIGCEEIKRHMFFRGADWEEILTVGRTPFVPVGVDWVEEGSECLDVEKFVEEIFVGGKDKKDGERSSPKINDDDFGLF